MNRPRLRLLSVAAALACACGSGSRSSSPPPPDRIPAVASPQDASVTFDAERAVSAAIPVEGGALSVTARDGTVYTLTVPPESLVQGVQVTMTPLASLTGVDMTGTGWRGVRLEPEGLHLLAPATLRIAPPGGERVSALGFSAHGDGRDFHRQPLVVDPARLELRLFHFSIPGACILDCGAPIVAPQPHTPIEWWSRLENELAVVDDLARERLLRGENPNADWARMVEDILRTLWVKAVEPTLPRIMSDCEYAEQNVDLAIWFLRLAALRGFSDTFGPQDTQIKSTVIAALENCWSQTIVPCIDPENADQVRRLLWVVRNLLLLGADTEGMNPFDPDHACGTRWTGTSRFRWSLGSETDFCEGTATFSFALVETQPYGMSRFQVESGTATWQYRLTESGSGCVTAAGPQTFVLRPEDGELVFFTTRDGALYSGDGALVGRKITYTTTCPDRTESFESDLQGGGGWLHIPPNTPGILSVPHGTVTLEGTVDQWPMLSTWRMTR